MPNERVFKKHFHVEKQTDMKGAGEIRAILSTTGNVDLDGDRFMNGSFDEFINSKNSIPMLWAHSSADIIGDWRNFEMEGDKLMADGYLFEPVQRAREASHLVDSKLLKGVSIGFIAQEYEFNSRVNVDGDRSEMYGFDFWKVQIIEASLVLWAANPNAEVENIKNDDGSINVRKLERHLAKTDLTRKEASTIIKTLSLSDSDDGSTIGLIDSLIAEHEISKFIGQLQSQRGDKNAK